MQTFIPAGQEQPVENQKMAEVPGRCIQIFCARKFEEPDEKPAKKAGKKSRTRRQEAHNKESAKSADHTAEGIIPESVSGEKVMLADKTLAENAQKASEKSSATGDVKKHE